jgi:hypothetical protein
MFRCLLGDCRGSPAKGAADCRQSLPPATAVGAAAPEAKAAPLGCEPVILGSGISVVRWLASLCAQARNRAALAPSRVADALTRTFKSQREGPAPDCTGTSDPDPAHDHREPTLGSAEDPGGAGGLGFKVSASYWYEVLFEGTRRRPLNPKARRVVYTYRCASCGYLERYAN